MQPAEDAATRHGQPHGTRVTRKILVSLTIVLLVQALFVICLVSNAQLLAPRNMPFGMVGSSQVIAQAQAKVSLDLIAYPNESAAMDAIDQGRLYGAYVTGDSADTLILVPRKSFFARIELQAAFQSAAHGLNRPLTVQAPQPLPASDPTGAVAGLLILPLLIGGYLAAVLVFKAARGVAAAPWRAAILVGFAILGGLVTDLIAGPLIGAYPTSRFWPLLPCFALITATVALAAAAIQSVLGKAGTLVVAVLLIVVGGSAAGGSGTAMLPVYWQNIGVVLPPQNGVTLIRDVLYFGGHNIVTPLIVLFAYALVATAVIAYEGRIRPARAAASAADAVPDRPARRRRMVAFVAALGVCTVMECLFAFNYMSSGHAPKATDMPFGVVGSSPVLTEAEKSLSLKVTQYQDQAAAQDAIDQAEIWGVLIPQGTSNTLIVVPSISDLAPLDLAATFDTAAKAAGQTLTVQQYTPTPLATKDPFGLVPALMLIPLLIGGYISSTLLMAVTGKAASRWRAGILAGFAIVAGLAVDLVAGVWLQGYAGDKFWIVWPICSLIIAVVAFVAAVLQKLLGPIGTLLTIIVIILFGNPSSGGANGVPYLPTFWRDIGPFLPPRNAYLLLHRTIYFGGHGITQALIVLFAYLVVAGIALIVLDQLRSEARVGEDAAETAAVAVPIGAAP